MRIDVVTCLPNFAELAVGFSMMALAVKKECIKFYCHDLRDYSTDKHKKIDDYQYGGGAGMVMMIEPLVNCLEKIQKETNCKDIIYMAPDGDILNQSIANKYSLKESIIIICGHYKGIDERFREHFVTQEISIGNYVVSGGELPAAVFIDSFVRLIPGVLSDATSALEDSFQDGLVAPPCYTRPKCFRGLEVPEILFSGNHSRIENWRHERSLQRTKEKRPNLLD